VTGRVPIGLLGLFMRFIGVLLALIVVIGRFETPGSGLRETVWKIAEGVSARLSGGKKRPNRDSFDPSCPLSEPHSGPIPNFQTVSEDEFSEVQVRDAERSRVRRVMSSSCSQPSPTKE
jgi:hypothetical protein